MNVDAIKAMGRPKGLPFRIGKVGHVGLYVKDLERSTRFYTQILGFQVSDAIPPGEVPGGAVFLRCATDHHAIALFGATADHPAGTGLHHLAMEVPTLDEVVRIREHLREHQVPSPSMAAAAPGCNCLWNFATPTAICWRFTGASTRSAPRAPSAPRRNGRVFAHSKKPSPIRSRVRTRPCFPPMT